SSQTRRPTPLASLQPYPRQPHAPSHLALLRGRRESITAPQELKTLLARLIPHTKTPMRSKPIFARNEATNDCGRNEIFGDVSRFFRTSSRDTDFPAHDAEQALEVRIEHA